MIEGRLAADAGTRQGIALVWLRPGLLLVAIGGIVWLRWLVSRATSLDGVVVGFGFGLLLLGAAALGLRRSVAERRAAAPGPTLGAIAIGVLGGIVLIGIALAGRLMAAAPLLGVAGAFGPWLGATLLVAAAEELVFRGVLFHELDRIGGALLAVAVTSVAFALIHVPTYGWHVVPLDFGVGIFLGGLRLAGGGWIGPAVAHAIADVATWWL